jgi:hypothetical protein
LNITPQRIDRRSLGAAGCIDQYRPRHAPASWRAGAIRDDRRKSESTAILRFGMFCNMKDVFGFINFADASSTRAVRLFEAFAAVGAPHALSKISQLLDTSLSTCHGLVKALQDGGYLYANKSSRQHYPTRQLLQIAETIATNDPVVKYFARHMLELRDITAETVILGALQKDTVVCLNVVESPSSIRYSARPGDIKRWLGKTEHPG